ncbi:MAG: ribosome-binding factor A [Rhodobacteraceae bacterium]|nr:ribosome-binding factor A [Paracoccaceae bacterium]MBV03442.1 ribosome-binding factor A [Paracoccaceae bacterium]MDG1879901.1 30S ribosome-binding factor RbfA [Paracoccaceae bacterium]MDG1939428.1 30S ribosome-binding factor RbfA [Paracoccaceae bacterium]|tara:strand:+ start:1420 stop:1815 length:396 start_codon:yes stop_codon:yes gene_type:complete
MANQFGQSIGPSQRQLRVGELIRRTLGEIFSRDQIYDEALSGISITVGEVSMSADLKIANVFVSALGKKNSEKVVDALNVNKVDIRKIVTRNVKLKFSPELKFFSDTTFDNMDSIRSLFDRDEIKRDIQNE